MSEDSPPKTTHTIAGPSHVSLAPQPETGAGDNSKNNWIAFPVRSTYSTQNKQHTANASTERPNTSRSQPQGRTDNKEKPSLNATERSNAVEAAQEEEAIFESVPSRRTQRYYVGGISKDSNKAGLLLFLKSKRIYPESVKLIDTNRGTIAAKLTVYKSDCEQIESYK